MVFQPGQPQPEGAGRARGTLNKRTTVVEGLERVYGKKGGQVKFWEQCARRAMGVTKAEADQLSLEGTFTDPQLPCLISFKMLADRLVAPLKPIERLEGDTDLAVIIARFTPEVDKLPESASTVPKLVDGLKVVEDQEVTPE